MSLSRRSFTLSLAATGLLPAALRPARAAGRRTLTVASLLAADKPETRIWHRIRDLVEARLPGRFAFRIVGNAALGGEKEVAEGIRLGSIDASLSTVSALSGWVPEAEILDLPFLFRDRAHVARVLAGPLGADLKARFAAQDFVVLGTINYGARHLLAKFPATALSDVAGRRIRVIQSPLHAALWRALGAVPTPLPITETYNALKTGVVDMMDLTKSAYAGFRLYEVVPCLIETAHIWATGVVYVSRAFWQGLSPDEQAVFAEAGREGAADFDRLMEADETASMAAAKAAGGRVFAPEDRAAWVARAETVWQSAAPRLGGMEKIRAIAKG